MYVLPMCITVYKIIGPFLSPSQQVLAVVPFESDSESDGIRLRVPEIGLVETFETILKLNHYEVIDDKDPEMMTWCNKNSRGGRIYDYERIRNKKLKTNDGGKITPAEQLDSFIKDYETNSLVLALDILNTDMAWRCYSDIVKSSRYETTKLSDVLREFCNTDIIVALMEVKRLRAIGKYSSVTSRSNKALHSLDFDIPLSLENFVDFRGFQDNHGITRLIGYQGELRVLKAKKDEDKSFELCNKFGEEGRKMCKIYDYRRNFIRTVFPALYGKLKENKCKIGGFIKKDSRNEFSYSK